MPNAFNDTIDMVGMVYFLPAPALHVLKGHSRVVEPTLVVPVSPALSVGRPCKLTDAIRKFTKACLAFAQRVLGLNLFRHVSVGTEPTDDITSLVADRQSTRQKPSVVAILAPERKRVLPWGAGFEALPNAFNDAIDMVGMVDFLPAPALHVFEGHSRVVEPTLVVPVNPALSVGRPGKLTDVVRKFAKARLAFAQRILVGSSEHRCCALALG